MATKTPTPQKKIVAGGALIIVFVLILLGSRDGLARAAWQKNRIPLSLFLVDADAELSMQIGNYYFEGRTYDLKRAKRAYEKAVAGDPKILFGHYQLSRIYFTEGDFARALEEINLELSANPENLRALYVRGLIYGYKDNSAKAAEDFRRFTEWAPKEWAGYNDLAWAYSKLEQYENARDAVEKAFQEIPEAKKNPWLWNGLGGSELNLKNYSAAKRAFEKAKESASLLTDNDWHMSYPGNDPQNTSQGLKAFRDAIDENLKKAESHIAGPL